MDIVTKIVDHFVVGMFPLFSVSLHTRQEEPDSYIYVLRGPLHSNSLSLQRYLLHPLQPRTIIQCVTEIKNLPSQHHGATTCQ